MSNGVDMESRPMLIPALGPAAEVFPPASPRIRLTTVRSIDRQQLRFEADQRQAVPNRASARPSPTAAESQSRYPIGVNLSALGAAIQDIHRQQRQGQEALRAPDRSP